MAKQQTQQAPAQPVQGLPALPEKLPHTFTEHQLRLLVVAGIRSEYGVAVEASDVEFLYGYDNKHEETHFDGAKVLLPYAPKTEYA